MASILRHLTPILHELVQLLQEISSLFWILLLLYLEMDILIVIQQKMTSGLIIRTAIRCHAQKWDTEFLYPFTISGRGKEWIDWVYIHWNIEG